MTITDIIIAICVENNISYRLKSVQINVNFADVVIKQLVMMRFLKKGESNFIDAWKKG